jgi:hypothetical protein
MTPYTDDDCRRMEIGRMIAERERKARRIKERIINGAYLAAGIAVMLWCLR